MSNNISGLSNLKKASALGYVDTSPNLVRFTPEGRIEFSAFYKDRDGEHHYKIGEEYIDNVVRSIFWDNDIHCRISLRSDNKLLDYLFTKYPLQKYIDKGLDRFQSLLCYWAETKDLNIYHIFGGSDSNDDIFEKVKQFSYQELYELFDDGIDLISRFIFAENRYSANRMRFIKILLTTYDLSSEYIDELGKITEDILEAYVELSQYGVSYRALSEKVVNKLNELRSQGYDLLNVVVNSKGDDYYLTNKMDEIHKGLISQVDVSIYWDTNIYTAAQMAVIREGLEKGLNVKLYAYSEFNEEQMRVIMQGLEEGLDIKPLLNPVFSRKEMIKILDGIRKGIDPIVYATPGIDKTVFSTEEDSYLGENLRAGIIGTNVKHLERLNNIPFSREQLFLLKDTIRCGIEDIEEMENPELSIDEMIELRIEAERKHLRRMISSLHYRDL